MVWVSQKKSSYPTFPSILLFTHYFCYGTFREYTTPPSPPIQRSQLSSSSRQNSSSTVPQSTGGRRLTPFNSDSNPFANFGRFGVDGGLLGEPIEMPRRRGGGGNKLQQDTTSEISGGGGGGKDLAPHLLQQPGRGGGSKRGGEDHLVPPWASSNNNNNVSREERINNRRNLNGDSPLLEPRRLNNRNGDTLGGGMNGNGKDSNNRRGGLALADEGGWRSVGTTREGKVFFFFPISLS